MFTHPMQHVAMEFHGPQFGIVAGGGAYAPTAFTGTEPRSCVSPGAETQYERSVPCPSVSPTKLSQ